MAAPALAADIKPAIVYGTGGKFDKSFNEAAYNGAEKFKKETGIAYRDFEPQDDTQGEQAIRKFASEGFSPVVALSFAWTDALAKVAKEFPDTKFVIIDDVVDLPNVQSVVFKEHEGSYLVGMLAGDGLQDRQGRLRRRHGHPADPQVRLRLRAGRQVRQPEGRGVPEHDRHDRAAWNDPARGGELAKSQIDQGADVVYAAAGATGLGVLQAAADAGKLGIGVDSNQNYLHPGTVLTSMMKRVDVAVYNAFKDAKDGTWKAGVQALGLKEGGVDWALDDNNKPLITDDMKAAVDKRQGRHHRRHDQGARLHGRRVQCPV